MPFVVFQSGKINLLERSNLIKKIILIIFILFIVTGCNYQELDDLAIINSISIDYEEEYTITLEIINNTNKEALDIKTSTLTGHGKTIPEALYDSETKLPGIPFYSHLELLVINTNTLNKFNELSDFFLRNPKINSNIKLITTDKKASDFLTTESDFSDTLANKISELIKNDYNNNYPKYYNLDELISRYISYGITPVIPKITLDNNNVLFDGMYAINKELTYFNSNQTKLYNILTNNTKSLNYDINNNSIRLYNSKTKIDLKNNTINIKLHAYLTNLINLNDQELKKLITKELTKDLNNFYKEIQTNNIDILGINRLYYQKTKNKKDYYQTFNPTFNIDINIDKFGLIFEVKDE